MAEVLDGLPVSYTDAMYKELAKPFTVLEFFKVSQDALWPCTCIFEPQRQPKHGI